MIRIRKNLALGAAALTLAAAASVAVAGTASAHPLTCFVTRTAPIYDAPWGTIVEWVGQGQGMDLSSTDGIWRGGYFWGGSGQKQWMQQQNLSAAGGGPC